MGSTDKGTDLLPVLVHYSNQELGKLDVEHYNMCASNTGQFFVSLEISLDHWEILR
jgi:hypothetical protein